MNFLMNKIETAYNFSEYELKVIRYVITAFIYDLSKLIILGVFFYLFGMLPNFLCALIPFFLLRTKNGGIHTNNYWTCLLMTFLVFIPTVMILPVYVPLSSLLRLILMVPCAIIEFGLGPILSHRKVMLDEKGIRKNRIASFQVVLIIAVLIFLFPESTYLLASFWMVIFHAVQLVITKLYKEVKKNAK